MRAHSVIKRYADVNTKIYILFLILFFTGLCVGAAIVNIASSETCSQVVQPLKSASDFWDEGRAFKVFSKTFVSSMKPVLFMWVAGYTSFSVYCIIISLVYKGGILGYIIGVFLRVYGLKTGLAYSCAVILPQYLFYIPVLFLMAGFSYKFALRRKKNNYRNKNIGYFVRLLLCTAGCVLVALADTYVTAFFMNLFLNGG